METNIENQLIWKTEEEQIGQMKKVISEWKPGYSRDGYVLSAEGKFIYRGVAYILRVLRYYNHTDSFKPIGSDRICEYHAVVEYPDETKPIVDMVSGIDGTSEFLFHDTLHSWNDKQTIEQQIEICHNWAKDDINNLLDGELGKRLDEAIKKLQEIKNNIENKIKEIGK